MQMDMVGGLENQPIFMDVICVSYLKQKCIFKSLPLEVLCVSFGHFLSPGELFLGGSYLNAERPRNISRKMFILVPGVSSVIQTKCLKSLLTSIAIFHCRKMLTWPWSLDHGKMFISCYIILQFIIVPYSFYFSVRL